MEIRYASVCSGVEAASLAWEPLGWRPAWFSEIEPFPCAVLSYRWPDVPNYGDMTKLEERILAGEIEAPDVLVGGTPCQAFSVAGLRNSLSDERGNLTLVLVRILNAIDFIRRQKRKPPCILVWENVPGVLNTKDNAFGCFLAALAGEDVELKPTGKKWTNAGFLCSPEREIGWRVLDAQYFGVPQRRRRIFVVAGAGGRCVSQILFEQSGGGGSIETRRSTEKKPACYPESSFGAYREDWIAGTVKSSGGGCQGGSETLIIADKSATLTTGFGSRGLDSEQIFNGNCVIRDLSVRRFTPLECERLQGFPDNYTRIPWRGKLEQECPDGLRYKAIGNSMAVPVMAWIGRKIKESWSGERLWK